MASLKNYIDSLVPDAKKRYKEKIALVDDIDPYATNKKTWSTAVADYPTVMYPDIVNYLLLTKSAFFGACFQKEHYSSCSGMPTFLFMIDK